MIQCNGKLFGICISIELLYENFMALRIFMHLMAFESYMDLGQECDKMHDNMWLKCINHIRELYAVFIGGNDCGLQRIKLNFTGTQNYLQNEGKVQSIHWSMWACDRMRCEDFDLDIVKENSSILNLMILYIAVLKLITFLSSNDKYFTRCNESSRFQWCVPMGGGGALWHLVRIQQCFLNWIPFNVSHLLQEIRRCIVFIVFGNIFLLPAPLSAHVMFPIPFKNPCKTLATIGE